MRFKIPTLLLLLSVAAFSANIRYASAQHRTIDFIIDPCTGCMIRISNGTGTGTINATYTNGTMAVFEDGMYKIKAITAVGFMFVKWSNTTGLSLSSTTTNPANLTVTGTGTSTLTAQFKAATSTIQPATILYLALMTTSIPVILRRARRPIEA